VVKKDYGSIIRERGKEEGGDENKVKIVEKKILGGLYKRVNSIEVNGNRVEIKNSVGNLYEIEEFLKFSPKEL